MRKTYINEITQRFTPAAAGLEDLADLVIPDIPATVATTVTITGGGVTLISDKYYGDTANELHLDLRDLVRENTYLPVPGLNATEDGITTGDASVRHEADASIYLQINVSGSGSTRSWGFRAFPYNFFPIRKGTNCIYIPGIDEVRIPKGALIPFSNFHLELSAPLTRDYTVRFVSATKNELVIDHLLAPREETIMAGMISCLLKLEDLPYTPGEPFYLVGEYEEDGMTKSVTSPVYVPGMEEMEQYAFLNSSGIYDIVPMSGALRDIPEYDIEVLQHSSGFEKVSGNSADLHEQNTGPISYAAAKSLAALLLSNMAYHFDQSRGYWRRIVIEAPSVDITRHSGVYSFTFTWRYADNDELDNL